MTADNTPVAARNIKTGGNVMKGYYAADLHDAWERYCPRPLRVHYFRYLRYRAGRRPEKGSGKPGFIRYPYRLIRYLPQRHQVWGGLAGAELERQEDPQREAEDSDQGECQPSQAAVSGQSGAGSRVVVAVRHVLIQASNLLRPLPPAATAPGPVADLSATGTSIRYLDHASDQGGSGGSGK